MLLAFRIPYSAIPPLPPSASTGNADAAMVVFALLIINKAGGLVYNRTFAPGLQKLDSNDYLILAGTFLRLLRTLSPDCEC